MIVITGAAGFIGSCLLSKLNLEGYDNLVLVDDFSNPLKNKNLESKNFYIKIHRDIFIEWLKKNHKDIDFIFHLGARTDTAEFNWDLLNKLNLSYSKSVWQICVEHSIPLLYASSAATYGAGELGYDDNHELPFKLKPLNPYGISKNEFDKFVLLQENVPPRWYGLKFFNVYGPNEYHKKRMASVVFHSYNQILENRRVKLFRSHRPDFEDGKQLRDFIYVKDVIEICYFFLENKATSGLYNVGTGKARSFIDLVKAVFNALNLNVDIEFIDIPEDIREKYQYFTEANIQKLRLNGYHKDFYSLEEGVLDYVVNYMKPQIYF